jgi:outer membrane protein, multidrug efflux system
MHLPRPLQLSAAFLLSSCNFTPRLTLPPAPVAQRYPGERGVGASQADLPWKKIFREPRLAKLIDLALANNRDLRMAMLRVEEMRAEFRLQRAQLLPTVGYAQDITRSRQSSITTERWGQSLGITSYELDLFGKIRSLKAKALANYLSQAETQRAAQLTLVAEVAQQYYLLSKLDQLILNTQQTLTAVEESYALNAAMFQAGSLLELDLRSAEAQVLQAKANLIGYERDHEKAVNAMVLLIGQPLPATLPRALPLAAASLSAVRVGLPSELLQRRPDILAAEQKLRAANADIGAARAAFFPTLSLTGSAGSSSSAFQKLFSAGTTAWSFAPQITAPIFTAGRNKATLDATKIRQRLEVANYEKAIQTAFREVADALAAQTAAQRQITALQALVAAHQQRYDLAAARDRRGVDSYLNVVAAQADLFNAQQSLIQARYEALVARIQLYQALGGGWH